MAGELQHKVISKNNQGFPAYLDFTKLRSEAIRYIGELSGKVWTDHNVHDPGITILETLIYALMDLGYRTNLPAADLFAHDPEDKTADNNFFLPSRILANNPLTITDLRKLLVDIRGIRNAWLEVDEDTPVLYCKDKKAKIPGNDQSAEAPDPCACDRINGLYHVYIQLEDGVEKDSPVAKEVSWKVRRSLMAHRNLCEDFIDTRFLCQLEIGLCADIEFEPGADPDETYTLIITALKEFFSPAPRFYTFKQLVEKGKSVDEIFAGRPYDITQSYGFVDTDEFEQLTLRKEIHLSDLYHLLFDVKGVRNVRNLGWMTCCGNKDTTSLGDWKLQLPKDHVPVFSPACSGFRFYQLGLPVKVGIKKITTTGTTLVSNARGVYKLPSPQLEPEQPKGYFRPDLADYHSIQHELPKVYGITEGGLEKSVPLQRTAKARQLQGFLLFFDQLLANYLMQLKNIRSLFSMDSPTTTTGKHTYFINRLTDAPYLKDLVRFTTEEGRTGMEGKVLAYPTSLEAVEDAIRQKKLRYRNMDASCNCCSSDFPEYSFCYAAQRDQAAIQLRQDLGYGNYKPVVVSTTNECYFFYLITSSVDFAMMSKDFYGTEQEAKNAATSFIYAGTAENNLRKFMIGQNDPAGQRFSFDIELNQSTYASYLQELVENEELFLTRRQDFLDHLLARFAERFTDFALLSAGHSPVPDIQKGKIRAEEKFLTHYEDISSNRGRAYDYTKTTANVRNSSGFEKRLKALLGVENWERHNLCHFEVEAADEEYRIVIKLFNEAFTAEEKTLSKQETLASLRSVYRKLRHNPVFSTASSKKEEGSQVFFCDENGKRFISAQIFPTPEKAEEMRVRFESMLHFIPSKETHVRETTWASRVKLYNNNGMLIGESKDKFPDEVKAGAFVSKKMGKLASHLKNANDFVIHEPGNLPTLLIPRTKPGRHTEFFDGNYFEYKEVDIPHLKERKKRYSIINREGTVQFDSLINHDNSVFAKKEFNELLLLMHDRSGYAVEEDLDEGVYKIYLKEEQQRKAIYFETFANQEQGNKKASELWEQLRQQRYTLSISDPEPDTWEFIFNSGDLEGNKFVFESTAGFTDENKAWEAAKNFYKHLHLVEVNQPLEGVELVIKKYPKMKLLAAMGKEEEQRALAENAVYAQKNIFTELKQADEKLLEKKLPGFLLNKAEEYIFKLVDKDNPAAFVSRAVWKRLNNDAQAVRDEMISQAATGYDYLDIYLAGDIFRERKDPKTKAPRYHYLVKCTNRFYSSGPQAGKELVLFESIFGYQTKEDAQTAFTKDLYPLLYQAMSEDNYGLNRTISTEEILRYESEVCQTRKNIVFIPKATMVYYGGYQVQREIIPLLQNYPVRLIGKDRYIYVAAVMNAGSKTTELQWRSRLSYATAQEAMHGFFFFLELLKYKGNFFLQPAQAGYPQRLYLREVLAVSAHGFASCDEAWGKDGVEKFICIAQDKGGFQHFWNSHKCHYSFYVACSGKGLVHPCVYETNERRDVALERLFAARHFDFFSLLSKKDKDHVILKDYHLNPGEAKELAMINLAITSTGAGTEPVLPEFTLCEWLVIFSGLVNDDKQYRYIDKDAAGKTLDQGKWVLVYNYQDVNKQWQEHILAESLQPGWGKKEWKEGLTGVCCYFPLAKKETRYYVDIRLPGTGTCEEKEPQAECGEASDDAVCGINCYTSWNSECCFESCEDAWNFYLYAMALFAIRENYKPVFDCTCGSYRIELHPQLNTEGIASFNKAYEEVYKNSVSMGFYPVPAAGQLKTAPPVNPKEIKCLGEIIAINPQQYRNEKMACEASTLALRLINSEGLHLVEHILLRPRCTDEKGNYTDCGCPEQALHKTCAPDPENTCHFKWTPGGDPDPCEVQEPPENGKIRDKITCFTPGCDPYSFIATVALPAWPARFHSKAAKQRVEMALRREAPAHIMLRILWMNPRDFCCFEFYYKGWNQWLAGYDKKVYRNCDFLEFLFNKIFHGLEDCTECIPCDPLSEKEPNCFRIEKEEKENEEEKNEDEEKTKKVTFGKKKGAKQLMTIKSMNVLAGEVNPQLSPKLATAIDALFCWAKEDWKGNKYGPCDPCGKVVSPIPKKLSREEFNLYNIRHSRYRQELKDLTEMEPDNKTVQRAEAFFAATVASPAEFEATSKQILEEDPRLYNEPASRDQLLRIITWKYLDLVCCYEEDRWKIKEVSGVFRLLREAGIDMELLYDGWDGKELLPFVKEPELESIHKILTGA
ncbi:MAG: hypothetical protein ABIT05_09085 [Chitinophagaceae bacterium]